MKYVAHLVILLLVVVGSYSQQPVGEKPVPIISGSGVVTDFKGELTLHSSGVVIIPQKGLVLGPDTSIETGKGSILMSLGDGSQVLIKPHSHVQLKAPEKSQGNFLQLFLGDIMAKAQKRLGTEPSFRLGTPTAVITVRGTRFAVEVTKKNRTIVEVYEGLVEVAGVAAPGFPIMIKPGFSTQVEPQGTPETPRSMQGSEGTDGREPDKVGPHSQGGEGGDGRSAPESPNPGASPRQGSGGENPD